MGDITAKEKEVLDILIENQKAGMIPLTIQAIAERAGYRSKASVHHVMVSLEGKGYIERDYGIAKSYRVIKGIKETYADRIRRMNEEEIALALCDHVCPGLVISGGPIGIVCEEGCEECWKKFLLSEVKDNDAVSCDHTG